jgi:hypothetical protein
MSLFASHSREQLREAYAEAWRKHRDRLPVSPLEASIADVIERHPEYQGLLADAAAAVAYDANPALGQTNPFLHMGLHLAVREQLATDRPAGMRALARAIEAAGADTHATEHLLMDALGETLWEAQRGGRAPDEQRYLTLARERAAALPSQAQSKHRGC